MKQGNINYKSSTIHYYVFGDGRKCVFCFHGYGEDGKSFQVLEPVLGKDYTLIAIDLPFHGNTKWEEGLTVTPQDIANIITAFTAVEYETTYLLGYSLGGRIALNVLPLLQHKIEKLILLAPDGLYENFWHWFATQTKPGNLLFKSSLRQPKMLFALVKLLSATRAINKATVKFVHYHVDEAAARLLLYKRWTAFRKFETDIHVLKDVVFENKIPVHLVFGAYDKVIKSKKATYFADGLEALIHIYEIDAGHQLLKEKYAQEIAGYFYK